MARTRIKICGITRPEDAALAAELGADAIGLNFFAGPRKIDAYLARRIIDSIPPLVTTVALTDRMGETDKSAGVVGVREFPSVYPVLAIRTFQTYGIDLERLDELGETFWPVCGVSGRDFSVQMLALTANPGLRGIWPRSVSALVLETAVKGQLGGTGQSFNWNWIAEARAAGELEGLPPIILAGGLTPENVAEAIRIVRPYAVDVSSGVEVPGKRGVKDAGRMKAFVEAVRAADAAMG